MLIFDNEQRIRWGSISSYWRPCSSLPVLLLAPMLLPVFLLLLVLLLLTLLHYECCSMMSLLLLFSAPMSEKSTGPWNKTFHISPCLKILVPGGRLGLPPGARLLWQGGVLFQGPEDFPAFGNVKSLLLGPQRVFWVLLQNVSSHNVYVT